MKTVALMMTTTGGKIAFWFLVFFTSFIQCYATSFLWAALGVPWMIVLNWVVSFLIGWFAVPLFRELRAEGDDILAQKAIDRFIEGG